MNEQTRLLALAHLKNGGKPADVGELMGISYASALKLRKELHAAEERDAILSLFNLDEAALAILLDSVTKQLTPAIEAFGVGELVEDEVHSLSTSITGAKMLDKELQAAASALANKITQVAILANNAETVLSLAKSLGELQTAFFGSGAHGSQSGGGGGVLGLPSPGSFEKHLRN